MVRGTRFLFGGGADKSSVLNTGNIVGFCSVKIAAGQKLFVKFYHFTRFDSFGAKGFKLRLASVNPNYLRRLNKFCFFIDP